MTVRELIQKLNDTHKIHPNACVAIGRRFENGREIGYLAIEGPLAPSVLETTFRLGPYDVYEEMP